MTDDELRAMVRQAIARVQGPHAGDPEQRSHPSQQSHLSHSSHPLHLSHASHVTFSIQSGADGDGRCIIEPNVMCSHCGYCKSLGH